MEMEIELRKANPGPVHIHQIRAVSREVVEILFSAAYLDWEQATIVLDGRKPFSKDFLIYPEEGEHTPIDSLEPADLAWRIYTLGIREPFNPAELELDLASGRKLRRMQTG